MRERRTCASVPHLGDHSACSLSPTQLISSARGPPHQPCANLALAAGCCGQDLKAKRNLEELAKLHARQSRQRKRFQGPRVRFVSRLVPPGLVTDQAIGARPGVLSFLHFIDCGLPAWLSSGVTEVQPPLLTPPSTKRPRTTAAAAMVPVGRGDRGSQRGAAASAEPAAAECVVIE